MAFSSRARRPGAFSASQALTDAPFAGEWVDEGGDLVTIKDSKILGADGSAMVLTLKSKTEVSFEMDGEVYHGTLGADGKLKWSDGAEWTRKGEKKGEVEERKSKAEAEKKAAEEVARRKEEEEEERAALEAKRKAQELARKKAAAEEQARRAAALEKAKLAKAEADERERAAAAEAAKAAAAQAAQQAGDSEPAAKGSSLDEAKAKSEAGMDRARQAFEVEKARKAAALERAKAAKVAAEQEAAAAREAAATKGDAGLDKAARPAEHEPPSTTGAARARSQAGLDKARQAYEAEKARKAAALERARAAKAEAEAAAAKAKADAATGTDSAGSLEEAKKDSAPVDSAKAKSDAGIDKAHSAFEAEKARKAAALEKARAAKAAEAAAQAADPSLADLKAKSEAGLAKARAAFEAEKARTAAALEKARVAKQAEQEAPGATTEAKAKSDAGLQKARSAFEAEKARKAAALERVRAAKLAEQQAAEQQAAEQGKAELGKPEQAKAEHGKAQELEERKAKSATGLDKARSAFEARAAKATAEAAAAASAAAGDDDDDEPPALTPAVTGPKRGSAFSSAVSRAGQAEASTGWTAPAKSKTTSASSSMLAGAAESLEPAEPTAEEPELLPLNEADFEPGIVVKLAGLKTKPELNGQWGVLVEFSEAKKRWSVRVDGMEDMMLKGENLVAVSQEEYDAWMADQAKAEASAKHEVEALLKPRVSGGKSMWTEAESGPMIRKPGEEGNQFDICMAVEPDGQRAARKIVDKMKERGACLVEANAPPDLLYQAYEEAEKLWKDDTFAAPMQDFGASELEMTMWNFALFQDEQKVKWIGEDVGENMQALRMLSGNLQEFAKGLAEVAGPKLNIQWNNLWDAMLVCYTGNKSYSYHLDNPCTSDGQGLPDNGIRMTLAYFINPHWSPEGNYNGGGLDVYISSPSEPPVSLGKARKGNRMRIAPHADTLVCFPSQRVPHQVIPTSGRELWFCLWMWCFDEEVMLNFPMMVQQQWQQAEAAGGQVAGKPGRAKVDEEEDEVLSD